MTDHDTDLDDLLGQLARAGLTEVYVDEDGAQAVRLTAEGQRVATMLAMAGDEEGEIIGALLDANAP